MRMGLGFDAHALEEGRKLVLGGVTIEGEVGLAGHSDADVISHSVADALLGAAGLGDLGSMFPDNDEWRGASSLAILAETASALRGAGWAIVNVDVTLIAEAPRIAPHRTEMIERVSSSLGIRAEQVSVKATTTDGLGATGRGEGMAALAIASIETNRV